MQSNRWDNWLRYAILIALVFLFVWIVYRAFKEENELFESPHLYTVGIVRSRIQTGKNMCHIDYRFWIKGNGLYPKPNYET